MDTGNAVYLSDVIDYDRDIKGFNLIRLYAGVGAGKNEWTLKLAEAGNRVLLITSRANTADAQSRKMDAKRRIRLDDLMAEENNWGNHETTGIERIVCTNSDIERFVKHKYDPTNQATFLWNKFDYIILDEAHSLTADASFSEAPFYVEMFLKYAHKQNPDCHIILMSGTQKPIDWLFDGEENQAAVHNLDFFEVCRHIEPENVRLMTRFEGIGHVLRLWRERKRVIYFAETIHSILYALNYLKQRGVPESDIGISYRTDERDVDFSNELVAKKTIIHDSLITEEIIPGDVRIFFTTSMNKEGINIKNKDIAAMFVESNQQNEIVQMAGRVREGLTDLCILYDAPQHANRFSEFERKLERRCVKTVRETTEQYRAICRERGHDFPLGRVKAEVENRFKAIRYDPLSQTMRLYRGRYHSALQKQEDKEYLHRCVTNFESDIYPLGITGGEAISAWFPFSNCYLHTPGCTDTAAVIKLVRSYLIDRGYLGKTITKEDRDNLTQALNNLLSSCDPKYIPSNYPISSLGKALPHYGMILSKASNARNNTKFIITDDGL